jgi:citrate lyase subunit beta/citryl-CoA lyase
MRDGGAPAAEDVARRGDPHAWTTLLFVPGDRPEMLAKAHTRGADAIVVDLEDAVAADAKASARERLGEQLAGDTPHAGSAAVCVRINAVGEGADDDLAALAGLPIDALVVPKAASPDELSRVRAAVDPRVALIAQVESACGIVALQELVDVPGLAALALGGEDLSVDLGVTRSEASLELLVPRALVALHARAAGLAAIDTVYTRLDDEPGLVREAGTARQLGFSGKLVIHPAQVQPVRRVFAPSGQEIAWARGVLDSGALDAGAGVRVVDGVMVDAPVMAQAVRILSRAG